MGVIVLVAEGLWLAIVCHVPAVVQGFLDDLAHGEQGCVSHDVHHAVTVLTGVSHDQVSAKCSGSIALNMSRVLSESCGSSG